MPPLQTGNAHSWSDVEGTEQLRDRIRFLSAQAETLDSNPTSHTLRALIACLLALSVEQVIDSRQNPGTILSPALQVLIDFLGFIEPRFTAQNFDRYVSRSLIASVPESVEISSEQETASLYGDLFEEYDGWSYAEESFELLTERFTVNDIPTSVIEGARCLDDGCGGGRYSVALARMGASEVIGVDISAANINDAKRRAGELGIPNVRYSQSSVLELPFPDNTFDFVFCNGVLHHTPDPERGLAEAHRVLKPAGRLWLYLYQDSGFLETSVNELIRHLLQPVPRGITHQLMVVMGFSAARRFHFLDNWYVPIRLKFTAAAVEELLTRYGFVNQRRLLRDVSRPHYTAINELIFRNEPYARFWYGEGEHRYIAEKPGYRSG